MKVTKWTILLLMSGALCMVGCGGKPKEAPPTAQGVTVDLPKLREAFASADADCQQAINQVAEGFRYGEYNTCIAALAKLDSSPGVTEAQKKVVAEVAQQVKELAAKKSSPPAQ